MSLFNKTCFKWARLLHSWAGLLFALLILLVGLTGTLLVWKSDYLWLSIPEARQGFQPTPESLASIAQSIESQFEANDVIAIQFATERLALNKVYLADSRYAYIDVSGNVIDLWQLNGRWEEWLYDLHHRLLLGSTGVTITGILALSMMPFMILGLIAFWPTRAAFKKGLKLKNVTRPQLLMLHRNLGVISVLPLMLMFLTGAILAFPDQARALFVEKAQLSDEYQNQLVKGVDEVYGEDQGGWLRALERAQSIYPDGKIRSVSPNNFFSPYKVISLQQKGDWHQSGLTRIYIDAEAGYMDLNMNARLYPLLERAYSLSYPLHIGKIGSRAYQITLTFFGLALCALALLGLISYTKKIRAKL